MGGKLYSGISDVELGLVVRLGVLREVLQKISIGGNHFWVACDPQDSVITGHITIGHGYPGCSNPYNASFFRLPVLSKEMPYQGCNDLIVLFDSHTVEQEFMVDLDEFSDFFAPIKRELGRRLLS
jgi:hypothetical protein